jgi:hypothetical protein
MRVEKEIVELIGACHLNVFWCYGRKSNGIEVKSMLWYGRRKRAFEMKWRRMNEPWSFSVGMKEENAIVVDLLNWAGLVAS